MNVRAGIIVTGTEVLTGRIGDRNGPWVSERLGELGVDVAHILCTGDRPADLEAALRFLAAQSMDLIVTTGGLGPTADDLTADVVARFSEREMLVDRQMETLIAERVAEFARRLGLEHERDALEAANRKQAMVPYGATALEPVGTAPGLVVPGENWVVIVLPGPPSELQAMWPAAIATAEVREVLARAARFETATLRLFGIPESLLAKSLREIEAEADLTPLEITTCLRKFELVIDVRYREGGERPLEQLEQGLRTRHGRHLYSSDGSSIDERVAELLAGRRIAIAESCTGGLLAARLTARPGASEHVVGGVVAYSNEAKSKLLGVPLELLAAHGAVSSQVAEAMAAGAMDRLSADVGVAITGVAGPGGGNEAKPVGYVCICATEAGGSRLARDPTLPGDRDAVRGRSVVVAMHMLRMLLAGEASG